MHKRILVALALLVLLSGVGVAAAQTSTWTPTPIGQWCYYFNFLEGEQGFSASPGEFDEFGGGFRQSSAEWGQLTLSYTNDVTVFPSYVDVILQRGSFTSGDIQTQIAGELFGLRIQPDPTALVIPTDVTEEFTLRVSPESASDFSNTLTLYLDASQYVYVNGIKVYGFGVSPFETDNCGAPTPTPAPATATATASPTHNPATCLLPGQPSPTPDGPTNTPAPTSISFNFRDDDYSELIHWGFSANGFSDDAADAPGTWVAGTGYRTPGGSTWMELVLILPTPLYVTSVTYEHAPGAATRHSWKGASSAGQAGMYWQTFQDMNFYSTRTFTGPYPDLQYILFRFNQSNSYLQSITLNGVPDAATPTPWPACTLTPTITPSISPTPTYTPTPFTLTPTFTRTPTRTPFPIIIPTTAPTRTPNPTNTAGPPTATLHPSITPTGTVGPINVPGGVSGDSGNGGVRGLGNAITGLGANLWGRVTGWVGNLSSTVGRLGTAWTSSVPTALPLLPHCKTDPLANELCALWYILTFTVFSGTLGSLIIPLGVVVIDLIWVFSFVRMVRAIVSQARQIRS